MSCTKTTALQVVQIYYYTHNNSSVILDPKYTCNVKLESTVYKTPVQYVLLVFYLQFLLDHPLLLSTLGLHIHPTTSETLLCDFHDCHFCGQSG